MLFSSTFLSLALYFIPTFRSALYGACMLWDTVSYLLCLYFAFLRVDHLLFNSVPAGLGKGQGCKINWAQASARTTKIRAQFSAQTTQNRAQFRERERPSHLRANDQNSGIIQDANETRCGHNLLGDR